MDKTRDVRRVKTSRFSPAKRQIIKQAGLDCENLKREKVRRLSILGRASSNNEDCEMGCVPSDGEDKMRPTTSVMKRFKFPRKFSDDCRTVDNVSVPRKLRSAIKKRCQESVSPPFPDARKPNCVELVRKDGMKKSKLKHIEEYKSSPGEVIVGPISKDEEEVVETLYALAGMFSDTDRTDKIELDGKLSEAKSLALHEANSSTPVLEVPKVEDVSKTTFPIGAAKAKPLTLEGSAGDDVKVKFLNQAAEPDLHKSKEFPVELHNVPNINHSIISLISKSLPASERGACNSVISDPSELSLGPGLDQPVRGQSFANGRDLEIAAGSDAAFRTQHELELTVMENTRTDSALWPGLSSTGLHSGDVQHPSLNFSAAKLPAWLGTATYTTRPCSSGNTVLNEKESRGPIIASNKSWKKCSAHVYISHLIKVLQITDGKDKLPLQLSQLSTQEGSNQESLLEANKRRGLLKNGLSGVVSANGIACSGAEKSPNEVRNAVLLHKRLLEVQLQASSTCGQYASQKQSFDSLPLSAGGCGVEVKSGTRISGNGQEPLTQFRVPYQHSVAQNTITPLSVPQNQCTCTFLDHQKAQMQLPPHLCNSASGASNSTMTTVFPKQQQLQQQQWLWAAQLSAQYKAGNVAASHLPNWHNGRQDSQFIMQFSQPILPSSNSFSEVLGPKYSPASSPQQQQLISNMLSSPPNER